MYTGYATRVFCLSVILASTVFQSLWSQSLVSQTLVFGKVSTGEQKSLALDLHLGKSNMLKVQVRIFGEGFSVDQNTYTLERGVDTTIMVHFDPEQNLAYNGEVFIGIDGAFNLRADLKGDGKLKNAYYSSTFNLWDKELMDALESITSKGHISLGYNGARDRMYGSLDNYNGKVTCAYTGREATFNSRTGANSNSFNCEHTWPQSKFCSSETSFMKADIHHLYGTDVNSNSRRGSYPLGKVSGSVTWQEGGSKLGSGIFEPRDEQKGASARSTLYMVMRYGDCTSFLGSQENTLREWANDFAPSTKEIDRNAGIFDLQKNRNPFVDVPDFIDRIYSFRGNQTRSLSAAVIAVDTVIQYAEDREDSTIFLAYIVNTGNADFEVSDVLTAGYNYTTSGNKVAPGEMVRIRIAIEQFEVDNRITVQFRESYLTDVEFILDLPMSVRTNSTLPSEPLFSMEGNLVKKQTSLLSAQFEIISLDGRQLYSGRLEEEMNLSRLPYTGVVLLRATSKDRYQSQSVLLR